MVKTMLDSELKIQLENQMQEGYKFSMKGKTNEAVDVWLELWQRIKVAMDSHQIEFIEDLNKVFDVKQSIYN